MPRRLAALRRFVRSRDRICPRLDAWFELRCILGMDSPPIAGDLVPGFLKILLVQDQLTYAAEHGKLREVDAFLRSLPLEAWHRFSPPEKTPRQPKPSRRPPSPQLKLPF